MEPLRPYERLPECVEYNGTIYRLDLSYGAFFAACDALSDARLSPSLRIQAALDILVQGDHPQDPELLRAVLELTRDDQPHLTGPRTMDVVQDWPYICAAFQQAYGIDLYADKGLHILRFKALLRGIPRSTRLADIINIRAADVPAPDRHNQKQIAELLKLKAQYALRGTGASLQEGWGQLFERLKARAKNG